MNTSNEERERLKRLAEAATPGPWESGDDAPILYEGMLRPVWNIFAGKGRRDGRLVGTVENFKEDGHPNANAAFIAAANPAAILSLIADLEAQAARVKALEEGLRPFAVHFKPGIGTAKHSSEAVYGRGPEDWYEPLTWGDFRRASALLHQGEAEHG